MNKNDKIIEALQIILEGMKEINETLEEFVNS
jgi:hypothetical protein